MRKGKRRWLTDSGLPTTIGRPCCPQWRLSECGERERKKKRRRKKRKKKNEEGHVQSLKVGCLRDVGGTGESGGRWKEREERKKENKIK